MIAPCPTICEAVNTEIDRAILILGKRMPTKEERNLAAGDVYVLATALCDLASSAAELLYVLENYPPESETVNRAEMALRGILNRTTVDGRPIGGAQ